MADFYRTNGNAGPAGSFISFIGKVPKAFQIWIANGSNVAQDLRGELGVNYAVPAILNALEANSTVLAYQIENTANGNISVLLEGAAGITASQIQATLAANGPYGNNAIVATGTVVNDIGFRLN